MIKILFLGANPTPTTRLALDVEVREITQRLRSSPHGQRIRIEQEWAVRLSDLQAALLRHQPAIVHFSGHGERAPAPGVGSVERDVAVPGGASGGLLVEDDAGRIAGLSPASLAGLFEIFKGTTRCVVLNACYSEPQAAEIRRHIDCVVGMTAAIDDRAAIAFSSSFYQALGFGKSLDMAFRLGKNEIALLNLPDHDAPTLVTRPGMDASRIVLEPSSWGTRMAAALRSTRVRWGVTAVAGIASAALVLRALWQPQPKTWGFWHVQLELPGERFARGTLLDIKARTDHDGYVWVFSPEGTQPILAWPHPDDERLALNTIEANQWRPIPQQGRDHYGIAAASQGSASRGMEELILIVTVEREREAALRHLAAMRPDLDVKATALASGDWGAATKTYLVLAP